MSDLGREIWSTKFLSTNYSNGKVRRWSEYVTASFTKWFSFYILFVNSGVCLVFSKSTLTSGIRCFFKRFNLFWAEILTMKSDCIFILISYDENLHWHCWQRKHCTNEVQKLSLFSKLFKSL